MFKTFNLSTIFIFITLLLLLNGIYFFNYIMPFHWLIIGGILLMLCFTLFFFLNRKWALLKEEIFEKNIFTLSIFVNLISLGLVYLACYIHNETFFEPGAADSVVYHETAAFLAENYKYGRFDVAEYIDVRDVSDYGYFIFLSILYYVFGPYTIVARLFHVLFYALTVRYIFKITKAVYNAPMAKTASLLTVFSPAMLFFIGVHLKETTMIFALVVAVWYSVKILLLHNNSVKNYIYLFLFIVSLFFFRTVLGIAFISSFMIFYLLNVNLKKNVNKLVSLLGSLLCLSLIFYYINYTGLSNTIMDVFYQSSSQTEAELNDKISKGGGAGLSVKKVLVTPLLFLSVIVAPFATFVFLDDQVEIAWLYSGNLMKNIIIFFSLYGIWFSWKYHRKKSILILSILLSYSLVLAVSAHSTSSRYQLVSIPFINILAAAGLHSLSQRNKKYFVIYLLFIFIAIFAWNYFKLSIRNLT